MTKASLSKLLRLGLGVGLAVLISKVPVDFIESYLYDLRFRLQLPQAASENLHVVNVTSKDIETLGRQPTVGDYEKLFSELLSQNPRRIVSLIALDQIEGPVEEKYQLAALLASSNKVTQATEEIRAKGAPEFKLRPPFSGIPVRTAPPTWDRNVMAKDGVTRRMMLFYEDEWMLHPILAAEFNPEAMNLSLIRGRFTFFGSDQALIDFKKGAIPLSNWSSFLNENSPKPDVKDKVVFVGKDLDDDRENYIQTPFDRSIRGMTKSEMHAQMVETLIHNSSPYRAPDQLNLLITILISIFTVYVAWTLKPGQGILILIGTVICL
jgi:CHASE2 domain-containing sensor protein